MAAIMIQLTPNERQMLHLLIKREKASSAAELARLTGVSKRTVYYSLNNLRHLFKQLGVDEFEAQVGGFCLTDSQRTAAQFWLKKKIHRCVKKTGFHTSYALPFVRHGRCG